MENMNTLEAYEMLKKVQFTDEQSREIVRLFVKVHETEPASRQDLADAESNIKSEFKQTELRLQKEIEEIRKETQGIRLEITNTEMKFSKEIEEVRLEIKNTEMKLSKEIEGVRLEIKDLDTKLSVQLESIHSNFVRWLIGTAIASGGLFLTALKFIH